MTIASSHLWYSMAPPALASWIWVYSLLPCRSYPSQSDWKGSISELHPPGLSKDFQKGVNPGFGWASQVHRDKATPLLSWRIWSGLVGDSPPRFSNYVHSGWSSLLKAFQWHDLVTTSPKPHDERCLICKAVADITLTSCATKDENSISLKISQFIKLSLRSPTCNFPRYKLQ